MYVHTHTYTHRYTHTHIHTLTHTHIHIHNHTCTPMHMYVHPHTLLSQGKLKYSEHETEGFEHIFDAFVGLFRGDNLGKAIVKA